MTLPQGSSSGTLTIAEHLLKLTNFDHLLGKNIVADKAQIIQWSLFCVDLKAKMAQDRLKTLQVMFFISFIHQILFAGIEQFIGTKDFFGNWLSNSCRHYPLCDIIQQSCTFY